MLTIAEQQIERLPITVDPEVLSGAAVFRGTRVPVAALLDNLAAGLSLDEFLENFPTVTREQVAQTIHLAEQLLKTTTAFKENPA